MSDETSERSENVLDAARDAAQQLGELRQYGEENSRLHSQSVEILKRSGMLSLWRPSSLGGHECGPVTLAKATEIVATADPAAAWLMHGTSAVWFDLRVASPELVDDITSSADVPVLGETFNRPMAAVAADGGFRINGSTPFASGSHAADWIGHTAFEGERFLLVYHPKGSLSVGDDWNSLGLRGSASNTVVAEDVFVPEHRVIDLTLPVSRGEHFGGSVYRLPESAIPIPVVATCLGVLRSALDAASETAETKIPFASQSALKHRPLAQLQFGRALASYRACRSYLHDALDRAHRQAERSEDFSLRGKADFFLAYAHVQQECAAAVQEIAKVVGTSGVYRGHPVEGAVRDALVLAHHAFGAEGRFATAAQAYWETEIDFPLLAMD